MTNIQKDEKVAEVHHPSDIIGEWGPLQRRIFIVLCLIYIIAPLQNMNAVFIGPMQNFSCIVRNDSLLPNQCYLTDNTTKCTNFIYDKSQHKRTLISEFDLVCDRAWLASAAQSVHQLGYMFSGVALGIISDRSGRLFTAKLAITLEIIAGFGQAFAPSIYFYMLARFFLGIGAYARFLTGYVLLSEWVGPKMRGKMSAAYETAGWGIGELFLPLVFYLVPDYFAVQCAVSSVEILLFIIYIFVVVESPRWLLTHGKYDKAERILMSAATAARLSIKEAKQRVQLLKNHYIKEEQRLEQEKQSKASIIDVLKDPQLLKVSVILYCTWFTDAFTFYGSIFIIENVGGNLYLNIFVNAVAGIIAKPIAFYLMPHFKRRTFMTAGLTMKALCLVGMFACSFNDSLLPGRLFFHYLSWMSGTFSYLGRYAYTTETFPTTMRQVSLGICSLFSRIGSVMSPFLKELTLATHLSVTVGLFASMTLGNAILLLLLPDTTDIQLPDNILQAKEDIEIASRERRRLSTTSNTK